MELEKQMYQVFDTQEQKTVKDGFKSRRTAKAKRNKLLGCQPDGKTQARYIVARGAAHPHGPSNGISTQQRGKRSYL